jgi:cyclohexyl-isocyanide hydratase
MSLPIGLLIFPQFQQLDLTGPYEVFSALPAAHVQLVWKTRGPVTSNTGLVLQADVTYADCAQLDVICVPGGHGVGELIEDEETLAFLRHQAAGARFVTSVCTGALVLGAAGLLAGRRATTHWAYHDLLAPLGATPVHERVVRDGNVMTGGGITAGIDFALTLAAELVGRDAAQLIQLQMEYAPAPPFDAGSPDTAPAAIVAQARERAKPNHEQRAQIVARAAARLRERG